VPGIPGRPKERVRTGILKARFPSSKDPSHLRLRQPEHDLRERFWHGDLHILRVLPPPASIVDGGVAVRLSLRRTADQLPTGK